jgi:hypothetical protein
MPLCPSVPWDWLNLQIDDLSDPRALAVHRYLACQSQFNTTVLAVVVLVGVALAILIYFKRLRYAALLLVMSQIPLAALVALFWGIDRITSTVLNIDAAFSGRAVAAGLTGFLLRAVRDGVGARLARQR